MLYENPLSFGWQNVATLHLASPTKSIKAFLTGLVNRGVNSITFSGLRQLPQAFSSEKDQNFMGDEKDDIKDDEGTDDGSNNDHADDQGQDDGAGQGDDAGQDDDKGKKPDDQGKKDGEDDDSPPPVRKTAADYYKERQERKAAKQANSQKKDDDGENGDDGDDIDPEDEVLISKVVKKQFAPVLEKIASQEEAQEAKDFFEAKPEFKPFENKILKWWKDPSRRHLPIETVALEAVGYNNLVKLGAQREKAAAEKAKKSNSGGGSSGQDQGKKGAWEMSKEEFAAEKERVLRNRQS